MTRGHREAVALELHLLADEGDHLSARARRLRDGEQIEALLEVLPARQLWINPDCGLKTRRWEEVRPSLIHMVDAVKSVREKL